MSNEDFKKVLDDAGIPTTEAGLKAKWLEIAKANGSAVANDNDISPFWRVVSALVTTPTLWIINLIIDYVLMNNYVKTATGIYLDLKADDVNLTPKTGNKAEGQLVFARVGSDGILPIPKGSIIDTVPINAVVYSVITTEDASINDGDTDVTVNVEALEVGEAYNLAAGYYALMREHINGVAFIGSEDWLTLAGADPETPDELRDRIRNQFGAVNEWHTDAVYKSILSSFDGVAEDNIYFERNAPRGPGTENIYIMLDIGSIDGSLIIDMQNEITVNENHGLGDDVLLFSMPTIEHDVTVTIVYTDELPDAQKPLVKLEVDNMIRCAFRQNQGYQLNLVKPQSTFSFSFLGHYIFAAQAGVASINFDNLDITSEMVLPTLGILTVNAS